MVKHSEWGLFKFDELLARVPTSGIKLQTSEFSAFGKLPIVDQSKLRVAGFTDRVDLRFEPPENGVIVFGDHTRNVKFMNSPFVVGADGVQLLRSRNGFDCEFLSRLLSMAKVPDTGYNRHFKYLTDLEFHCPEEFSEQKLIAKILSDADTAIESLEALIAKKRDVHQATMQQLLTGRTRLPGFTDEWRDVQLGELGRCLRGVSYRGDSDLSDWDTPTTIRLLRSNNIQNSVIQFDDVQYVNCDCVSEIQILLPNDVVICMANGSKVLVGKSGLFSGDEDKKYTFGAFMGCFRTNSGNADAGFVRYLFLTKQYQNQLANLLAGSSINNLTPKSIESLEFAIPQIVEQKAIAEILISMGAELEALTEEVAKMRMMKEGMMQDLLTGKVRLV